MRYCYIPGKKQPPFWTETVLLCDRLGLFLARFRLALNLRNRGRVIFWLCMRPFRALHTLLCHGGHLCFLESGRRSSRSAAGMSFSMLSRARSLSMEG